MLAAAMRYEPTRAHGPGHGPAQPQAGEDDELIARVHHGDREAHALLFERHRSVLWRVARRLSGNGADADDLVQETYCALVAAAARYHGAGTPRAWLIGILRHVHRRQVRAEARRHRRERVAVPALLPEPREDPRHHAVRVAMERLPARWRLPLELRYRDGLDFPAIAAALGAQERTVRTWVHRGLVRLRAHVGAEASVWSVAHAIAVLPDAPVSTGTGLGSPTFTATAAPNGPLRGALVAMGTAGLTVVAWALATTLAVSSGVTPVPRPAPAPPPLAAVLATPIPIRFAHDQLPAAMALVAQTLPRPMHLPWVSAAVLHGWTVGGWDPPYVPWTGVVAAPVHAQPVRAILDVIAGQLGLRWTVAADRVVFWRPLTPAERSAIERGLADASLWLDDTAGSSQRRTLLIKATSDWAFLQALAADPRQATTWHRLRAYAQQFADPEGLLTILPAADTARAQPPEDRALVVSPDDQEDRAAVARAVSALVDLHRPQDAATCRAALTQAPPPLGAMAALVAWGDAADLEGVLSLPLEDERFERLLSLLPPGVCDRPACRTLLCTAIADPPSPRRDHALALLATCRTPVALAALEQAFLHAADGERRVACADALARSRDPAAEQLLLQAIRTATGPARGPLVACLWHTRSPATVDQLAHWATQDPDGDVRGAAIDALRGITDSPINQVPEPSVAARLRVIALQALDDVDAHARGAAATVLMDRIRDASLAPRFAALAIHDPDGFVRANALVALSASGTRALAIEIGAQALADPDAQVRLRALSLIAHPRPDTTALLLQTAAQDPDPRVRGHACAILGWLYADHPPGSAQVMATLRTVAQRDPVAAVRTDAARACDPAAPAAFAGEIVTLPWQDRTQPAVPQAPPRTLQF